MQKDLLMKVLAKCSRKSPHPTYWNDDVGDDQEGGGYGAILLCVVLSGFVLFYRCIDGWIDR